MALLELNGVTRSYSSGDDIVTALDNISLSIAAGEMIAIMGTSGSGKSTLMNILGCLDKPTAGSYRVGGQDTATLDSDALAELRRERFGFIFQRYHLLPHLSALGNVEIPAIYAGYDKHARGERATSLLKRLGLADRATHRPSQLSGGQQQRVSIARALMNGGEIILADEPSGALDHASGREVMNILKELHGLGHTIIIVTHDAQIASHADRVVEISDGRIVRDTGQAAAPNPAFASNERPMAVPHGRKWAAFTQMHEALKMALHAMVANRMRSALTMLGIIIGITAVVSVVALSQGAQHSVLKNIRDIAANTIWVIRGTGWGDDKAGNIVSMMPDDMVALAELPDVENVRPDMSTTARLRHHHFDVSAKIWAGTTSLKNFGMPIAKGREFNGDDIRSHAKVVVIDHRIQDKLFEAGEDPLGQLILVGNIPCAVIGVLGPPTGLVDENELQAFIPYTTASSHLMDRFYLDGINVIVREGWDSKEAEKHVQQLLELRHGKKDFFTFNADSKMQSLNQILLIVTFVLSLVAAISLVVSGVGVMNIMLVSVTERTREIGIRMAVGARQRDVQNQFLIEAVTLCLVGGLIGVTLTFMISLLVSMATNLFRMEVSLASIMAAFFTSTLLGVLFGFWPARNASRLDPIEALARD
jgi:macrolide transport system ATP-binding/permease protein